MYYIEYAGHKWVNIAVSAKICTTALNVAEGGNCRRCADDVA